MSKNESYIAMTRALEMLVMTSMAEVAAGQADDMPVVQEVRETAMYETDLDRGPMEPSSDARPAATASPEPAGRLAV